MQNDVISSDFLLASKKVSCISFVMWISCYGNESISIIPWKVALDQLYN